MKIVFTGGGTGGHIFPILALVREMKRQNSGSELKIYYLGPSDSYAVDLLIKEGVKCRKIITGKIRRYFSLRNIFDFLKVPIGIIQSFFWLFFLAPDIIFSKGGHGSFPVSLIANLFNIPLFLHESDAVPGLASKISSNWAMEIFVSFLNKKEFPNEKIVFLGNPVRKEVFSGSKEKAKEIFNLQADKPLILILGGSQGAQIINETILDILPDMLRQFEIIHQTGRKNLKSVKAESNVIIPEEELKKYYHLYDFLKENEYAQAFAACDFVVSRAGSGSIFEIAANAKPAILIPLPDSAQDHQLKNAYAFQESGGGEVIEQKNLTGNFLLEKLKHLSSRPDILLEMSKNSQRFSRPRAGEIIASYLLEYLRAMKSKK